LDQDWTRSQTRLVAPDKSRSDGIVANSAQFKLPTPKPEEKKEEPKK
jgi:hypothetical protein